MKRTVNKIIVAMAVAVLASCGTKKVVTETTTTTQTTTVTPKKDNTERQKLQFVQRVADLRLYQKNIVGDMSFNIKAENFDHTLPGALHMRRDEVIRLQVFIPLIGSEVGRIEFTPTYVLVVDRLHKEYIKADYSSLAFLKDNGLSFYSLQSLFWNELMLPGSQRVSEGDLQKFDVDLSATTATLPVTLANGKMNYRWNVAKDGSKIVSAVVEYLSSGHGNSNLTWNYSDFKTVGVKQFPASQSFTFTTTATGEKQKGSISFSLDQVTTDSNWEPTTQLSSKYKQVEAKDVFDKLLKM